MPETLTAMDRSPPSGNCAVISGFDEIPEIAARINALTPAQAKALLAYLEELGAINVLSDMVKRHAL